MRLSFFISGRPRLHVPRHGFRAGAARSRHAIPDRRDRAPVENL